MSPFSRKQQRCNWSERPPRWGRAEAVVTGACEWGPLEPPECPWRLGPVREEGVLVCSAATVAPEHCTSLSSGTCLLRWPELLQEYSWLRSSALPSPQTVSSQPTAVSFPDLLLTVPLLTLADTHLRLGCAGLWPGPSMWVSLCPAYQ